MADFWFMRPSPVSCHHSPCPHLPKPQWTLSPSKRKGDHLLTHGRTGHLLTHRTGGAIVDPSGVREGGANPPLPRNCKRRELEPICWSHWDANPGKAVQTQRSVSQETGQMPSRAVSASMGELKATSLSSR